MTTAQDLLFALLAVTVALFFWGRWRHDVVAGLALLGTVAVGLVPAGEAFAGFGHPAVITVACVLVLSRGLHDTGAVDALARRVVPRDAGPTRTLATLVALGAALSAFMNNVGALALLMPLAVQAAQKHRLPPGRLLMPLAFGTILGGMTTLIGTPPNLIVAGFRARGTGESFAMFDFTPVGLAVAGAGLLFLILIGWRIVPAREGAGEASFDTGAYLTEARLPEGSAGVGMTLREVEALLGEADAQIVGMVRNNFRVTVPNPSSLLRAGDILVIEAEPEALAAALSKLGLRLEEDQPTDPDGERQAEPGAAVKSEGVAAKNEGPAAKSVGSVAAGDEEGGKRDRDGDRGEAAEVVLLEMVPTAGSELVGRTATDLLLRTRFGLNLLAISRRGRRSIRRLRSTPIQPGDVLLLQGPAEALAAFAAELGCVPLAPRPIRLPDRRRSITAVIVLAVVLAGVALGGVPPTVAFAAGVLAFVLLRVMPPQRIYEAIDWSVIVLLAALLPVAGAMESTGAAGLIARTLLDRVAGGDPVLSLTALLVVTMVLSDFVNNAATAAVMCPIAAASATQLGANGDAFLMAVAIGASCAFLTPIGHQNNTLILGPGGFRFGDYWRLGILLELVVVAVGVPLLLWIWPL